MGGLKRVARRFNDWLSATDPAEFERLLAGHYRQAGYVVQECGTGGTGRRFDGGVDLRLLRGSEVVLVQCKRWNAMKVAHNPVHELLGIVVAQNATRGIVVNSGEFTQAAKRAAANSAGRIELVDGRALRAMLGPDGGLSRGRTTSPMWQRGGLTAYQSVRRAWWRTTLALAAIKLVLPLLVFFGLWWFLQATIEKFGEDMTARAAARAANRPPASAPPQAIAVSPRTRISDHERLLRAETVRGAALRLNGVTSAVWLPDGTLFLGMATSTSQMRATASLEICEVLSRYPELRQRVEVQQTGASGNGSRMRVGCPGRRG